MLPDVDLVEERIELAGRELAVLRPRDAEALLDEEAFEHEEFLPYWAELWPSGLALARHVAGLDLAGAGSLELGCGLGLPSLAAALAGARVLATRLGAGRGRRCCERNAAANGIELEVERVAWTRPGPLVGAGAVRPRARRGRALRAAQRRPLLALAAARCAPEVLVADPRRPAAAEFLERAARRVAVETTELRGRRGAAAPAQTANSVSSGSRWPRSTARSTSTQRIPRDSASVRACGLNRCAARTPSQAAFAGSRRMKPR